MYILSNRHDIKKLTIIAENKAKIASEKIK